MRGAGRPAGTCAAIPKDREEDVCVRHQAPRAEACACSVPAPGLRASTRCGRQFAHYGRPGRLGRPYGRRALLLQPVRAPHPRPVRSTPADALKERERNGV